MLTLNSVRKLGPGRYRDSRGLYLVITAARTRKWVYRYRIDGKSHDLGLGSYPAVGLAEARRKRDGHEGERAEGQNPIALKRARRASALEARQQTFSVALDKAYQVKAGALTNEKYRKQWRRLVERYAIPALGNLPVRDVSVHDIETLLRPIWTSKPESARKLAHNLKFIFDWAIAKQWRNGDNPALLSGPLGILLPRQKHFPRRHPALAHSALPGFMARLRCLKSPAARALQFLILTAARTEEVLGMGRGEVDIKNALWTCPASRMKSRKEHRVPLSRPATQLIANELERHNQSIVFLSPRKRCKLSNMAMRKLMRDRFPEITATPHGFRSTFRDWAAERECYDPMAIEYCLAHALPNRTVSAYLRTDFLKQRRRIMNDWAGFALS
ncbi:MAG: integrase [Rhodospirillaceae bacterium]|nr:integrase [Rhodospirillaceae bacterium]